MKVNLALAVQNQKDWARVIAKDWNTAPQRAHQPWHHGDRAAVVEPGAVRA